MFYLGSGADTGALFKDAEAAGWSPAVYLLGTLVGRNITEMVPVKMKDKVFLAFPTIPADISAAGAAEYSALLQKNKLASTHAAAQASAMAAARILVHALELSGKDLSRERLVTTLEGLYEFDTGLMPKDHLWTKPSHRRIGRLHRDNRSGEKTVSGQRRNGSRLIRWTSSMVRRVVETCTG